MSAKDKAFVKANLFVPLVIDIYFYNKGIKTPDWATRWQNKVQEETGGLRKQSFLNAHARILKEQCLELGKPKDLVDHFHRLIRLLAVIYALPENREMNYELFMRVKQERTKFLRNDSNLRRKYKLPHRDFIAYDLEDLTTEEMNL